MVSARAGLNLAEAKEQSKIKRASLHTGQTVLVRATQYNWLKGQIKRLARGGVAVWVADAQLVVHVPFPLAPSHLSSSSSPPPTPASPLRLPTCKPGRYLLLAVRPSHLSHRALFQRIEEAAPFVDVHLPCLVELVPPTPPAALAEVAVLLNPSSHAASDHATSEADAPPERGHFPDSPLLSPESSTSQRVLHSLESIPESSDSSCTHATSGEMQPTTPEKVVKTAGDRFCGPHLEVPHSDNGASSSSSSSTASLGPSPGSQR